MAECNEDQVKLAPAVLFVTALFAAEPSAPFLAGQKVSVSHTERLTLPAGGMVSIEHSFGVLRIEGWDRPEVEIATVKTTKEYFRSGEDAKGKAQLNRVQVAAAVEGKDVVVTTRYPHRSFPPRPWAEPPVDLEYVIHVPMDAAIQVKHGLGAVSFQNLAGSIRADVRSGDITLDLPSNSQYAVKAGSNWGAVESDFPGSEHRRFWMVGHNFTGSSEDGAHKLDLKASYGDIIVMKTFKPEATH